MTSLPQAPGQWVKPLGLSDREEETQNIENQVVSGEELSCSKTVNASCSSRARPLGKELDLSSDVTIKFIAGDPRHGSVPRMR